MDWVKDCEKWSKIATECEAKGDTAGATGAYDRLSGAWLRGASHAASTDERRTRMERSLHFRRRAVSPEPEPAGRRRPTLPPAAGGGTPPTGRGAAERGKGEMEEPGSLRSMLSQDSVGQLLISLVDNLTEDSSVAWEDIGGLDHLKRELKYALALSVLPAPDGIRIEYSGDILMYGPPGTGKTMLAAALSNSLCRGGIRGRFFNVHASALKGHYQGNTEKSITLLYETARESSPSLVFFDEIDGLCRSRDSGDTAGREILGVLLQEMDGMAVKDRNLGSAFVLTVAATNRPWDLDPAILSRFGENRVYVPPPDQAARRQILGKRLGGFGYALESESLLDWLAEDGCTAGYSGRDLRNLTARIVRRMWTRANQNLYDWADIRELESLHLRAEPITKADLSEALRGVKGSVTPEVEVHFRRWSEDPRYRPAGS